MVTWLPLISHAMWNIQWGSTVQMQLEGADSSYGCIWSLVSLAQTSSLSSQDTPLHKPKPSGPRPCKLSHLMDSINLGNPWSLQQAHLADKDAFTLDRDQTGDNHSTKVIPLLSDGLTDIYSTPSSTTKENLASKAPFESTPIFSPQIQTPQLHPPKTDHLAPLAIIAALLKQMQSTTSSHMAQPLTVPLAGSQDWAYRWPYSWAQLVKSWKSCFCWITAIIQKLQDTAWDLTAHQNIKSADSLSLAY